MASSTTTLKAMATSEGVGVGVWRVRVKGERKGKVSNVVQMEQHFETVYTKLSKCGCGGVIGSARWADDFVFL